MFGKESKRHIKTCKRRWTYNEGILRHTRLLVRSIIREIEFKKKEMKYIERELKQLVNLLDYQLETMPGIELVTHQH